MEGDALSMVQICTKSLWQAAALLLAAGLLALGVNAIRPDGIPLIGDWSPEARLSLENGTNLSIPIEEAEALFFSGEAVFLDARDASEYASGHIYGARNLPWMEFETAFEKVMGDVSRDVVIVTYCDGEGCGLSRELALALLAKGYTHVRVLVNGWTVWRDRTLPVDVAGGFGLEPE